ncbi:MAG TPA: hypothetical protein VGF94_07375 [Kofleriaceae bacterium]|jgi:hypothetical protein
MKSHVDERGEPCTRHPSTAEGRIYELALLGSRMPSFHHDVASKLQSLMMALDELSELAGEGDGSQRAAIDTGMASLRDLREMLNGNRALAKPSVRSRVALAELVQRAADRVGVKVRGAIPECDVRVAASALTQALAQLIDLVAGPERAVEISVELGDQVRLALVGRGGANPTAGEALALATHVIDREDGTLACAGDAQFTVRLPLAIETAQLRRPL